MNPTDNPQLYLVGRATLKDNVKSYKHKVLGNMKVRLINMLNLLINFTKITFDIYCAKARIPDCMIRINF